MVLWCALWCQVAFGIELDSYLPLNLSTSAEIGVRCARAGADSFGVVACVYSGAFRRW